MKAPAIHSDSVAAVIARFLHARGVERIFALCGGHIMPIWMQADAVGIQIVDVRDERAAVYMAHAHAELTGQLGVALVTAGPGMTNAITGIANAHVARAPVFVIAGCPPRAQADRGALQDLPHAQLVSAITRYSRTLSEPSLILPELDKCVTRAFGDGSDPGPVFIDVPTDVLRARVPVALQMDEHLLPKPAAVLQPDTERVAAATDLLWSAKRPLVISGRGARIARHELTAFLDSLGAPYLDTGESRGLVSDDHPSVVAAMRGRVMQQADVVLTVGRRLDFQLAYGSPAVFGKARFIRVADAPIELCDNRRAEVELFAHPGRALSAITAHAGDRQPAIDTAWMAELRDGHLARVEKLRASMAAASPDDAGRIHPNRLLAELNAKLASDAIVIADGGDFLSFARVGLNASTYLDPGSLGCIGVGTPFGIAASLAFPDRDVVVATGDGAFGFNAMEIDTAVRHKAPLLIVVANNGAWQIEVHDQTDNFGKVVGTQLQFANHALMAQAFGMHGERVDRTEDLPGAIDRALAHRPALLDVLVAPDARSSDGQSGLAWVPDLQPLAAWDEAERRWREDGDKAGS